MAKHCASCRKPPLHLRKQLMAMATQAVDADEDTVSSSAGPEEQARWFVCVQHTRRMGRAAAVLLNPEHLND